MKHEQSNAGAEFPASGKKPGVSARWKSIGLALVLPGALVALLLFVFREQLVRTIPVETAQVVLLEESTANGKSPAGKSELLFQASGWVEADPWAIDLPVKTDGFIEDVFIKEGERVTNGQIVATLDATDAQLDFEEADANVQKHNAALIAIQSAAGAARKQAEAAEFRVAAAVARLNGERDTWERFSKTPPDVISHTERVAAEQAVVEFEAEEKAAQAALKALEAKIIQAESEINVAEAALAVAKKQRDIAGLALERTVVRSNIDGIVLHRYAHPGDKRVMKSDSLHSVTIAAVYDPELLQVRVDVPIAEASKVKIGQPARISTALFPGRTFEGRVTRIVGQADLQRNTLQVKVKINEPDERLRPDVLCRVEFFGDPSVEISSGGYSLWIPVGALDSEEAEQSVWVVDPLSKTVGKRGVKLAAVFKEGYRAVENGVRANETVVVSAEGVLSEGARVKEVLK